MLERPRRGLNHRSPGAWHPAARSDRRHRASGGILLCRSWASTVQVKARAGTPIVPSGEQKRRPADQGSHGGSVNGEPMAILPGKRSRMQSAARDSHKRYLQAERVLQQVLYSLYEGWIRYHGPNRLICIRYHGPVHSIAGHLQYEERLKARQEKKKQDNPSDRATGEGRDLSAPISKQEATRRKKAPMPQKSGSSSDRGQGPSTDHSTELRASDQA